MITSLRCENFRCFRDTGTIELAPLTLLVGENNSGKSAITQALHLPAHTLDSEDPAVCLRLSSLDYDYGSFKDAVFQHDESLPLTLTFGTTVDVSERRGGKLKKRKEKVKVRLTYGYLLKRKEIYLDEFVIEDSQGERLSVRQSKYTEGKRVTMRGYKAQSLFIARLMERRGFTFEPRYDPFTTYARVEAKYDKDTARKLFGDVFLNFQLAESFISSFRKLRLLGPLRDPARRTYLYTGELAAWVGPKGERALPMYSALIKRAKRDDVQKVHAINNALYQLGFIKKWDLRRVEARYYEFWTQHKASLLLANLADTGFGASQVLPVIVSLYTSPPGSTLVYQQPEVHLHPAAQAELGSVFARACTREKAVVIETHSENLILRILTEVAKGKLKQQDVRIYYMQPKRSGHQVLAMPLDNKGRFMREWPKGFFEENYIESLNLFRAREEG